MLLKKSIELDPSPFFVHLQLGNVYLRRNMRNEALKAYADGLRNASFDSEQQRSLREQIQRLASGAPLDAIRELRSPAME